MQLQNKAWVRRFLVAAIAVLAVLALSACGGQNSVLSTDTGGAETSLTTSRVPWDYRLVEGTVGDLVGSDMTILPDNDLLPNDNNYATGDKIWVLQFMDAELTTDENQKNEVRLSSWTTLKSYPDQVTAEKDLAELKVSVTTDVNLVGVYKTEYKGQTRNFAVLELPTGNRIKQPIDDARYTALKQAKTASVVLEEVHDFADYDLAYAKFRGWAN
ncbi:MAG: signal peptide protein [Paenibacillus macerans]|uniref:signal peptide protein n=1 Tax=Paenibacillus macerans TaxID=44252 RepID=UPI00242AFF0D|nr:signal peptide protein [Paenibacillus macerans]MBS5913367.1 signal peptide protein [Paenibacillus macerans]